MLSACASAQNPVLALNSNASSLLLLHLQSLRDIIDVAISSSTKVRRVSSAISEGSINFYISLLLTNTIILIINKNSSQESE
jgi:hypothetical protein